MTLGREDLIAAARKLWGAENGAMSNRHEMRFGSKGSKSLNLNDLTWYDHEAQEGGGVVELCTRAGIVGSWGASDSSEPGITYDYRDEKNQLLFQVVRKPGHVFFQRKPDGAGGWVNNIKGVRRVLYRLPKLLLSDVTEIVFVCEGEKDADNLARLGFVTTTNPGGAGKWRGEYGEFLRDRDVIILPDNDEPGEDHARKVKRALSEDAQSCRILKLPGLGEKGDVTDWIVGGGTAERLRELVALLPADDEEQTNWLDQCFFSKSGDPLPILANALTGLRGDKELKGAFTFNEMLRQPMITRSEPVPIRDEEITEIHEYLQRAGLRRISRDNVQWAIFSHASKHRYHPVRQYLEALQWDGNTRLDTWLSIYLGAHPSEEDVRADKEKAKTLIAYNSEVGAKFLISMVARIFKPGCKADHMLVLEGPQGKKKSMACSVLAGDEHFTDHLPDIKQGKEVSQHLRGKWIVEISEMHAISRAEATELKAFLSRTTERYRPPFHRIEVDEPRQCVFIGTSNKDAYLRDETGGRRFWPVKCGKIDIDALREDRDQLLAEAVQRFHKGEEWWPDPDFEEKTIRPQQEERFEFDEWFNQIAEKLKDSDKTDVTVWEVAETWLGFESRRQLGNMDQKRIAACLRALSWEYKHTDKGNKWLRPKKKDPA